MLNVKLRDSSPSADAWVKELFTGNAKYVLGRIVPPRMRTTL